VGPHTMSVGGQIGPPFSSSKEIFDTITVVPTRLSAQVGALIAAMNAAGLGSNRLQPLVASLQAAAASFDSENLMAGINQLNAFENKVHAQVARGNAPLAAALIQTDQEIVDEALVRLGANDQPR